MATPQIKPLPLQIAELQQAVAALCQENQALRAYVRQQNRALRSYVNSLGDMLGMPPLADEVTMEGIVHESQEVMGGTPVLTTTSIRGPEAKLENVEKVDVERSQPDQIEEARERVVYASQPDYLMSGSRGFIDTYITEDEEKFKLTITGDDGLFEFNTDEVFASELASLWTDLEDIAQISVDDALEDPDDAQIIMVAPGTIKRVDEGEWEIVTNPVVRIAPKGLC